MSNRNQPTANRRGFTLVEVLTVIVIIGILAAISVPAIGLAVRRGKQTAQKAEITALSQAVEQYAQKYGDYPPAGGSEAVFKRHMRTVFPRMAEPDITLLARLTDNSNLPAPGTPQPFHPVAMDRAEALVFFLGGFSGDTQRPLTGSGGPLDYIGPTTPTLAQQQDLSNYQYNATRDNSFFDFDPARLTIRRASDTDPLLSSDERDFYPNGSSDPRWVVRGGNDLLPTYLAVEGQLAPIVYFDSRTYGSLVANPDPTPDLYNGYVAPNVGAIRPYKTEFAIEPPSGTYGSEAAAFAAVKFHNPDTFQIITPGLDGLFGSIVDTGLSGTVDAIHFVTETGRPFWPNAAANSIAGLYFTDSKLGSQGFQDRDWDPSLDADVNGHLDNITNFSSLTLEGDLE